MHGIQTIAALNEAAARSKEKAEWPSPVPAGAQTESVDRQPGSEPPLGNTESPAEFARRNILADLRAHRGRD